MYTSEILGLQLNNLIMDQVKNQDLEERLEKIESHLASIARTRNIQLQNRKRLWIGAAILAGVFILVELLVLLGIIG